MKQSILEYLENWACEHPDKLCLADAKGALTYAQAWASVCNEARTLSALGVSKGNAVVIECDQSSAFIVRMLAIQLVGAVAVPLEKKAALARQIEISRDTDARLFIGKSLPEELSDLAFKDLADELDVSSCSQMEWPFPEADDIAEILFSTGTTGKSKGIVITHRNNIAIAENVIEGVAMKSANVEIVPMPLSHSHGLRRTYANIVNGSSVVFADGVLALKKVFNLMDEYQVTSMDISPAMLSIIFKLSKDRLGEYASALDYVQLGSAPLAEDDKQHLARLLPDTRLYNFYGSTESGCSCLLEFNQSKDRPHCIGKPTVNAHFIIVDEQRNPIQSSPENLGFIATAGSFNMKEYFKAPELTSATMENGYIYTKDLGYIDDEGYVFMLGRADDVINFGGVKISPEEIESAVSKSPIVKDCACIPVKDDIAGQIPLLCITLEDGAAYDAKEFKYYLAESIDANKQPQRVEVIDEIPRTFNGKIRRNYLVAQFDANETR